MKIRGYTNTAIYFAELVRSVQTFESWWECGASIVIKCLVISEMLIGDKITFSVGNGCIITYYGNEKKQPCEEERLSIVVTRINEEEFDVVATNPKGGEE